MAGTLTDTRIRTAKPQQRPYKLFDGDGLCLLVTPAGGRLWRLRYRYERREKMIGLGAYPGVSLSKARALRHEARVLLGKGINPSTQRRAERATRDNSFGAVTADWVEQQSKKNLAPKTRQKLAWTLDALVLPYLASLPITSITAPEVLTVLKRLEDRNKHETAHRTRQRISQIFRYAIATGRAQHDPTAGLRGAITPLKVRHHSALTSPRKVGQLLRAIDSYEGQPSTAFALKIAPYVFVRPGELRAAEWCEFDLEAAEWRIPAARMKMRQQHIVALAPQVVDLIRSLQPFSRGSRYLFPSLRTSDRPISNNTINAALRRLGYTSEEQTGHGFRSIASTLLNEQGFSPDLIELQLAHEEPNAVTAAYQRNRWASRIDDRRKMMLAWADYLDGLKAARPTPPAPQESSAPERPPGLS